MRRARADARRAAARGGPRWRSVAALAAIGTAVAMWVLVIGGHSHLRSESLASQAAHASNSLVRSESASVIGHPHIVNGGSWGTHPETLASAVLPNSPSSALAALGVVLAVAGVAGWLAPRVALAGRGPPGGFLVVVAGHDLLTRLGLSRR